MARYAWLEVTFVLVVGGIATVLAAYFLNGWALVPGLAAVALLWFYRDPPRRPPAERNVLLSPADGRIVSIQRQAKSADTTGQELRIVIFLSVWDVHVNRVPCSGLVTSVRHQPGQFLNALRAESTDRNECNTLVIQPRAPLPGPVRVRQIAGVLARRIVCAVAAGDEVTMGQPFGMIKLGSRAELSVPEDPRWRLHVSVGRHVKAGLSVLASLQEA